MKTAPLHESGLPLLVTPESDKSVPALAEYIRGERDGLLGHGAVLFRGFDIGGPEAFEEIARAVDAELKNDYFGTSPRDALTRYVFSASELPPFYPIPQHCEMSFLPQPPRRLMFCCLTAPQSPGGETPLADFRAVWRDLDPAVRARFEERGVRYVRNYAGPEGGPKLDPWKLKRWDEMFQTTDRAVV
jgi:alpha-ketoglutarate-dependent taurine dioxygenase